MSKINKRTVSILLVFALIVSLAFAVGFASPHAVDTMQSVTPVADELTWEQNKKSITFRSGDGGDHITVEYPGKISMDITESLESAGYYFRISSGHYGGSDEAYRISVYDRIWEGLGAYFNNMSYEVIGEYGVKNGVSMPSESEHDNSAWAIVDNERILINAEKVEMNGADTQDNYFKNKINLKGGSPKSTVSTTYLVNSGLCAKFEWWPRNGLNKDWTTGEDVHASASNAVSIDVTIYDKSALRTAISDLSKHTSKPGYNNAVMDAANDVVNRRYVTQGEINAQVDSIRAHIDALTGEWVSTEVLRESYDLLNGRMESAGYKGNKSGYIAIENDLTESYRLLLAKTAPKVSVDNAKARLDYYNSVWDEYLSKGYKVLKGTIGATGKTVTYLYPGTITIGIDQDLQNSGYEFVVDADWHPESTDYRIFFDAGVWGWGSYDEGKKLDCHGFNDKFNDYNYKADHASPKTEWAAIGFDTDKIYHRATDLSHYNNLRFNPVSYTNSGDVNNRHAYLLVSGGNNSYRSTIIPKGTPKEKGEFTYTYNNPQAIAQQWSNYNPINWENKTIDIAFVNDPVNIKFVVTEATAETMQGLRDAITALEDREKSANGRVDSDEKVTIDNMLNEANALLQKVGVTTAEIIAMTERLNAKKEVSANKGFETGKVYCVSRDIYANVLGDNYVYVDNERRDGNSNGVVTVNAKADGSDIIIKYPDGQEYTLKLNSEHTGGLCNKESKCTVCKSTIAATGKHNEKVQKTVEGTCITKGHIEKYCSNCGKSWSEETDYNRNYHEVSADAEWTFDDAANCVTVGSKTTVCACGETLTEKAKNPDKHVAPASPDWQWKDGEAGTCTVEGTRVAVCACGHGTVEDKALDENNHNLETTVEKATCTAVGHERVECTWCDYSAEKELPIDPDGHVWDAGVETVEPTCETEGMMTYTCTCCDVTREDVIRPLGHTWDNDWVVSKNPTESEEGERICHCEHCNEEHVEAMPALVDGEGIVGEPEGGSNAGAIAGGTVGGVAAVAAAGGGGGFFLFRRRRR